MFKRFSSIRAVISLTIFSVLSILPTFAFAADQTGASQCVDCHSKVTPKIVSDWKLSKHSQLEVTCAVCHGDQHQSASDLSKVKIPTPDTCAQCHQTQVEQYKHGKHSKAWAAMMAMPTIHWQPMPIADFHDLSPRGFHNHSPTPGFCF